MDNDEDAENSNQDQHSPCMHQKRRDPELPRKRSHAKGDI